MFNIGSSLGDIGLSAIRKITDIWKGSKSDSLIDYTQVARVEPIVLIDTECLYLDSISDIQQSLLSIFAGYYLQAVALSTSVGKIKVMQHLDKLNPRRNPGDSAVNSMGWLLAQESYTHALPTFEKKAVLETIDANIRGPHNSNWTDDEAKTNYYADIYSDIDKNNADIELKWLAQAQSNVEFREKMTHEYAKAGFDRSSANRLAKLNADKFEHDKKRYGEEKALANLKFDLDKAGLKLRQDERNDKLTSSEVSFGRDTMKDLKELANLSVGKMFSVSITDGLHKAEIMVSIRLMASSLPSRNLIHILSIDSKDNSAKERYHSWRAGRLEFIKDLILCQDLIDEHRRNLMSDKDGIYTNLVKRAQNNKLSTILSANPSVATASNICIISSNTAEQLELATNIKLSDAQSRSKIFKSTYLMLLCVVDVQWERLTIYSRGIRDAIEISSRDIKNVNKNSGPDISEIIKAYSLSNAPSL